MTFIDSIPIQLLFFSLLFLCTALGLFGAWLVRHKKWMVNREDNDAVALTHAFAGVLYAVALGLMVVNVQSGYTEVESVVMQEANQVEDIYIDATGLTGPGGERIQLMAERYINDVFQEWDSIADQAESDFPSHDSIQALSLAVLAYNPGSEKELVIYGEIFSGLNHLLDLRRERLHLGRDGVGPITWVIVALGGLITVGMSWFYETKDSRTHYGLVGMMSVMFSLMIFLIIAMDHPLQGQFSVDNTPFAEALLDIESWHEAIIRQEG